MIEVRPAVNNVPNENVINRTLDGLSSLQRSILDALPGRDARPVPTATIMQKIGTRTGRPSNAERAAVSRSLSRLVQRGHAVCYSTEVCRPGKGNLWSKA